MSMTCIEFRRQVGADPTASDAASSQHRLACRACAEFLREQQRLDKVLSTALQVPVPAELPARIRWKVANEPSAWRRRIGMAATLLLSLGIGFGVWTSSTPLLADEVVAHVLHEPELLLPTTQRAEARKVSAVMSRSGFRLDGHLDDVAHAGLCPFRDRLVPHLVMMVDGEPVSVLLLRNQPLDDVETIHEDGFDGLLVPTEYGSMAIVAGRAELVIPVRAQLEKSVNRGI